MTVVATMSGEPVRPSLRRDRMPSIGADNAFHGDMSSVARHHMPIGGNLVDGFALEDLHPASPRVLEQRRVKETAADGDGRRSQGNGDGLVGFVVAKSAPSIS
jgi:hypothetical protein